ncbi:Protein of unknown function DUF1191 protein [Actinidia chinensis var. chinensis]|uniref:Uncharacterized protein n=1 Tax=Actinidia chinensis var. chinensis TaxID=1590841 RepID=A0A2R6QSS0_ACTCC|nr:Protein of unknown function DUF1191 protein [Actinidia chinensis var. chinensis]
MRPFTTLCLILTILPTLVTPQSLSDLSARSLDSLLQAHAFKSLTDPRTGIPYDGHAPVSLDGVRISAVRLRSGSLRTRGFIKFKEFSIPIGVAEQPYVERLVLVYHNLGNWSSLFYPLPGYDSLSPILGLLAYDGANLPTQNLPELDLRASEKPIVIRFRDLKLGQNGSSMTCVWFDLDGSVEFDNVVDGDVCLVTKQGHFSIVAESIASSSPPPPQSIGARDGGYRKWNYGEWWVIGGCVLLGLLGVLVMLVKKWREEKRIGRLEKVAEGSVALETRDFGGSKVPMATGTRTRPVIEKNE